MLIIFLEVHKWQYPSYTKVLTFLKNCFLDGPFFIDAVYSNGKWLDSEVHIPIPLNDFPYFKPER